MQQIYSGNSRDYRRSPRARRRRRTRLIRRFGVLALCLALCVAAVYGGLRVWRYVASGGATTRQAVRQIEAREDIPESLLELAQRNPEAAGFVADYPGRGEAAGEIEVTAGQVPQLLQWDARWGYESYGGDFMAVTGCAPTCLSMVAAGLTGDGSLTPLYVAGVAESGGFFMKGTGTSWDFMTGGAALLGIYGAEIGLSQSTIDAYLAAGQPVICSVRPGDFTTAGHFIVLAGYAGDGGYKVYDPNSPARSSQSWSYEQLEPQIKNLWGYSLA